METKDKLYYYHNDINGAPLRLTDEAGNIVWNVHYDIFGKIDKLSKNEIDNPIRMQGQYEDEETGLYYNRYRYYDPVISAYVSQDPLGLGAGENVYAYTLNSFKWCDPLGLSCKKNGSSSGKENIKNNSMAKKIEENAAKQLAKMESKTPNAHYYSRHGAGTTIEQQYLRATEGITPDGFNGSRIDSSRFLSNQTQLNAAQRAQTIYKQTGKSSFKFDMGETIGEGYTKGGSELINTSNVQAVFRNGELYTMYPKLK